MTEPTLLLSGHEVRSVFSLLGDDENSATKSLGWAMQKCPTLVEEFCRSVLGVQLNDGRANISLQRHSKSDKGYTDLELLCPGHCHVIVEAKRGWLLPEERQLRRYVGRLDAGSPVRSIVSVSAASQEYADARLVKQIGKVRVLHRSWADIRRLVQSARSQCRSGHQKVWLQELVKHLTGYVQMRNLQDNMVYVLSLSTSRIRDENAYTWIDVVEKDNVYFHPMGRSGWPAIPPNYIGFRYRGKLQSVHFVQSHTVVTDLSRINRKWPKGEGEHFVYKLGPPMKPCVDVSTGSIYPSGRVWCAIDTLLSGEFGTISAARDATKNRLSEDAD